MSDKRLKALVIDDTPDLRDLLSTILEEWNVECVPAEDGRQALELLKTKGPFDFCTVDIFMPKLDGYGFVEAVRKERIYDKVKLLMVTTEVEQPSVVKALDLGADEYLMKPYTSDMVEGKLRLMRLID